MRKYLFVIAALLVGCQAPDNTGEMKEEMPAIPQLSDQTASAASAWNSDWSAGNAEGLGNQYAEDAIVYPPGDNPVVGRDSITGFWAEQLAFSTNGSIESVEAESDGSIGYEIGNYVIQDSTGVEVDHGNYMVVWKYVDGAWKIYRDTWSTNVPAEGM